MAPINSTPSTPATLEKIDTLLKSTIQILYTLQSSTHGYLGPETHTTLIHNIQSLTTLLTHLSSTSSSLPTLIPPEIVAYVSSGRNPDIYTREFVELVQRGNAYLRGKEEALRGFRDELGREMVSAGLCGRETVEEIIGGA